MCRRLLTVGLCAILVTLASSNKRLVCYYDRTAAERPSLGLFTPSMIDPNLCTHIIFAFAHIGNTEIIPIADPADFTLYEQLNALKDSNPSLKTLLAVGGPDFDNQRFSSMVSSSTNRGKFITSVDTLFQTHNFDGINLDWRYPGDQNSQPPDQRRFTDLCREIKQSFSANNRIISATVSGDPALSSASYEFPDVFAELDFINVLTYNFTYTSATTTSHHSPLSPSTDTSTVKNGMEYWVSQGADPAKLNLGMGAYGVAYTLADPTDNGVGAAVVSPGSEGSYCGTPGFWSYYETCLYIQGGDLRWITAQSASYAVIHNQWVGYDSCDALDIKLNYLKAEGYGGVSVWALDLDDFTGQFCGKGNNPFITFIKNLLVAMSCTATH